MRGAHQVARVIIVAAVADAPGKLCTRDSGGQQPRAGGQAQVVVAIHIRAPAQRDARQHVRCAAALARPHRLHMQVAYSRGDITKVPMTARSLQSVCTRKGTCKLARQQHRLTMQDLDHYISHSLYRQQKNRRTTLCTATQVP